jgi:hypothetical protein
MTEALPIAERSFDLQTPGGDRVRLKVTFGPIYKADDAYRCPVRFIGWGDSPPDIWGDDSLQSFLLAVGLVHGILQGFISRGGRVFYADTNVDFKFETLIT